MHKIISNILLATIIGLSLPSVADTQATSPAGIISHVSSYNVSETGNRLEAIFKKKGITLFARINHTQGAESVNLSLRPTEVIIFGNPKVGTPLMQCAQTSAIDLPQKFLLWEDAQGTTHLSYNAPSYIAQRHHMNDCQTAINKVTKILNKLAIAATSKS